MTKRRSHVQRRGITVNAAAPYSPLRRIQHINGPAQQRGTMKHDHYSDYGWPEFVTFDMLYKAYIRNSIAGAAVAKTIEKTWQDDPEVWETNEPIGSKLEGEILRRFEDLRVWQRLAEADRRSMVGRYGAVIMRLADGLPFDQPVTRVPGGLYGLIDLIPAWETQLIPIAFDTDQTSLSYGFPTMYQFVEASLVDNDNRAPRQFAVHPDRVLIWSDDGTLHCQSALLGAFNDLIDLEKIKGGGGEGFWKTARGAPIIEAPEGMRPDDLAKALGVGLPDVRSALNDQLDDFNSGFDKGLMLGGLTAKPMQINLPSPEHFVAAPLNSIAAHLHMPVKILMGSQTGERASTEDAKEWAQTCHARRVKRAKPMIREFLNRLERFGIIPERDWVIGWADLTEATGPEKIEKALKMAEINAKTPPGDLPAFTPDEIRAEAGFPPGEWYDDDGGDDEPPPNPELPDPNAT